MCFNSYDHFISCKRTEIWTHTVIIMHAKGSCNFKVISPPNTYFGKQDPDVMPHNVSITSDYTLFAKTYKSFRERNTINFGNLLPVTPPYAKCTISILVFLIRRRILKCIKGDKNNGKRYIVKVIIKCVVI